MDEFCLFFYPVSKVRTLRIQLLTFQQGDESLGAAWARFMHLVNSGLPHGIPEEMLMQHFVGGLNAESTHFIDMASAGSVLYKTVDEVQDLLNKVLTSTEYTKVFDDPPEPTEKQQIHTLSASPCPPPPFIEEITEPPPKTPDPGPLIDALPQFISPLHRGGVHVTRQHICHDLGRLFLKPHGRLRVYLPL